MPRFRTGHRNDRTIYYQSGDEPSDNDECAGFAADPSWAVALVAAANRGLEAIAFTDLYNGSLRDAMGLTSPDAPPSAHESPSKPPAATGQPADDSGPQVLCYSCRTGDHGCCTGPPSGLPLLDDPCQCTAPSHELD